MSVTDLMAQGVARAFDDCGLTLTDVDGVFAAAGQSRMPTMALCEYLRLQPRSPATMVGGSSFRPRRPCARARSTPGLCDVAVIAYGSTQRSAGRKNVAPREYNPYETPYRPVLPASAYALAASRHFHQFGTTREQLAEIAVAARQWALLNPAAWETTPLTVDDVLGLAHGQPSPHGARLLPGHRRRRRRDRHLGRARPQADEAARLRAGLRRGDQPSHDQQHGRPHRHRRTGSGRPAYTMAELRPADIDAVEVYDAFTITTLLFLEDLGFCPKGEGGPFVRAGGIAPGGAWPSTPTAAACPTATPACTACSC